MQGRPKSIPPIDPTQLGLERCRPFIDAVGDQVLVISRDHGVIMSNKAFLEHSGMREDEVAGRRCHELTHRSPVPCAARGEQCPLDQVLDTGNSLRVTHEHFDAAGSVQYVDIIGAALRDTQGNVVGMVESIRDVTRQKQLEAELRLRNSELEEARRLRDEFTSTICHELRNILNVLSLNAAVLERAVPEDTERKRARLILGETRRLARLVGDLSDAVAIETQRFSLAAEECDLTAIVVDRAEAQQLGTERHTISIAAPGRPVHGSWDAERIGQVIDNLISNAIKYSPSGGPILVAVTLDAGEVRVSVTDRGVGIPEELVPRLFEPYARAHRNISGLGLGLYVSRGIVEAHGGRIWAEREQTGTTVLFALPLG
jgi:PAS domain S-box-containing protein